VPKNGKKITIEYRLNRDIKVKDRETLCGEQTADRGHWRSFTFQGTSYSNAAESRRCICHINSL